MGTVKNYWASCPQCKIKIAVIPIAYEGYYPRFGNLQCHSCDITFDIGRNLLDANSAEAHETYLNSSLISKAVHIEADIKAGLEEQKIRGKLIELGWTPPQGQKDSSKAPAVAVNEQMLEALKPLVNIANAYDKNELDDEARKYWGQFDECKSDQSPSDIELYQGRGGKRLLTLADCFTARAAIAAAEAAKKGEV